MAAYKLALVLSGGGMGGAAHIGAIKALEEFGLIPDAVLGASIGAFVGSVYASGATPQMLIDGWQAISHKKLTDLLDLDLSSLRQAVTSLDHTHVTGFLLGQALMQVQLNNYVHARSFAELAHLSPEERKAKHVKSFYASATSLLDGVETVFCEPQDLLPDSDGLYQGRRLCHHVTFVDAVRASFSLPAIFKPFRVDLPHQACGCQAGMALKAPGYHLYVDGAIKDDYPITIAAKVAGADKIIGINLTKAGAKANFALNGGLPDLQSRILKIIAEDQYEADRWDKDVARVDLLTIDPAIGDVAMFDMSMGDWLIERGYQAVKQCLLQKGLEPALSRQDNLDRLFPPMLVDYCPDCGQTLPEPLDLGSNEQYIAHFPLETVNRQATTPSQQWLGKSLLLLKRWPLGLALIGLISLFLIGGFQFWWVYRLGNVNDFGGLVFVGGGLIYAATVLVTALLIGSWLTLFFKGLLGGGPSSEELSS
jgi:NTE family protein